MQNQNEEWGAEIPIVDGKRPVWLGDDDLISIRECHFAWLPNTFRSEDAVWHDELEAIRLPASHWAYLPLSRGFTPWAGGERAPEDWDGGEVLLHTGDIALLDKPIARPWLRRSECLDIIGYHPRGEVKVSDSQLNADPDTVTIRRMTEAEVREMAKSLFLASGPDALVCDYAVAVLDHLGLLLPEPSQAERIAVDLHMPLHDVERVIAAMKGEG